ncbi:Uncharacterized protein APZ42_031183 [Daphnia magna]|uniref:Uncharacterized protein n=1 Tax=Daphnia magna TaxID=35525 RepID=A0A164N2M4_9CRUS|nr:Uncharacterized protein APZ42_031183 [Daphnia magna]
MLIVSLFVERGLFIAWMALSESENMRISAVDSFSVSSVAFLMAISKSFLFSWKADCLLLCQLNYLDIRKQLKP